MENNVLLSEVPQLIASRQLRKAITVLRTYVTDHPFDGAMDVMWITDWCRSRDFGLILA